MATTEDTGALFLEYQRTKDRAVRDRLILTYAPLVKFVAGRLGSGLPAHVDEGDLVSYGLLGLIGAIERYDPAREIKFETYAIARSMSRARARTERGTQSSARSSSMIAPLIRAIA